MIVLKQAMVLIICLLITILIIQLSFTITISHDETDYELTNELYTGTH